MRFFTFVLLCSIAPMVWTQACGDGDGSPVVIGAEWIAVSAGSFWMSSPDGDCPEDYPSPGTSCTSELGRYPNEELHYVTLTRDFELMRAEVTQGDFDALMGWNPSEFEDCGDDCPVESVNWYEAAAFANELSRNGDLQPCYVFTAVKCEDETNAGTDYMDCMNKSREGIASATVKLNGVATPYECQGYRLPTESEWEYAVRAGSLTVFYPSDGNDGGISNPDDDPNADQIAWCYFNSDTGAGGMPHEVGGKEANAWGFYDMSGNVWEWAWDWYGATYPSGDTSSPAVNPTGAAPASSRVVRGGSWNYNAYFCRSAYRVGKAPASRGNDLGFRLAKSIP